MVPKRFGPIVYTYGGLCRKCTLLPNGRSGPGEVRRSQCPKRRCGGKLATSVAVLEAEASFSVCPVRQPRYADTALMMFNEAGYQRMLDNHAKLIR